MANLPSDFSKIAAGTSNPLYQDSKVSNPGTDHGKSINESCKKDSDILMNSSSKELKLKHVIKELALSAKEKIGEGAISVKKLGSEIGTQVMTAAAKAKNLASGLLNGVKKSEVSDEFVITENDLKKQIPEKSKEAEEPVKEVESKPVETAAPQKKEHSKEELDQFASKMKAIREKRAERKNLKEELDGVRNSEDPKLKKAVDDTKPQQRYKQKVENSVNGIGIYRVGKHEVVNGKKVYSAPKSEIPLERVETVAKELIKSNDRDGLRRLCNTLFIGLHGASSSSKHDGVAEARALRTLLNDPDSNLEGAEKLLKGGVEKFRANFKPSTANTPEAGEEIMKNVETPKWASDPEAWVEISHGGGENNIQDFLEGRSDGYTLENFGTGIQVSPNMNERDNMYAQRAYSFFDRPAIFKARIQAKHLQKAPNATYEAGLTPENVKHLQNVRVEKAPFTGGESVAVGKGNVEEMRRKYGDAVANNLDASRIRMENRLIDKKPYTAEELRKIGY